MIQNLRLHAPLLALVLLLCGGCNKDKDEAAPVVESPVYNKEVTFSAFTEADYREERWKDSKMKLALQVRRRSTKLPKEEVVFDTTLGWMPFRDLPLKASPLQFKKQLQEINREHDVLVLDVTKVVSINGYETVFEYDQPLDHARQKETIEVKL